MGISWNTASVVGFSSIVRSSWNHVNRFEGVRELCDKVGGWYIVVHCWMITVDTSIEEMNERILQCFVLGCASACATTETSCYP